MDIYLANPRGFCAGVDRAIAVVEQALNQFGAPVHVRHEIVHNPHVLNHLRARGAVFVESLDEVPNGAVLIFSAHGTPADVEKAAQARGLRVFDGTCPLVTKVHLEIARHARQGNSVIYIGHRGHAETLGSMGHFQGDGGSECTGKIVLVQNEEDARQVSVPDPERVACATQTTLSVLDTESVLAILRQRFPLLMEPPKAHICYATDNRQRAMTELARRCDTILVLGAQNSSNSLRLVEVALACGARAHLLSGVEAFDGSWLDGCEHLGITAGASSPEDVLQALLAHLQYTFGPLPVREFGEVEHIVFRLPRGLQHERQAAPRRMLETAERGAPGHM
ncbi:4-hydroxy-3-methylbut-2-enyl diphosphate reductase [Paraburkholderia sp. XV]|uniref:4-hydroxy-3-methylbut-2-enyl diphosphate reductase n=1 Tax=Paraburkholderia sp. XV TaxID=2831520 RepID=UPI001CD32647|nr:4-hydroxy-3-methylbut-2-enyl diphosphate reductase [Paraburkholderia sp. XV]